MPRTPEESRPANTRKLSSATGKTADQFSPGDEAPGTTYFEVHRGRDVEHAAEGRELLGSLLVDEAAADRAVAAAEEAFRANWKLLDGVS